MSKTSTTTVKLTEFEAEILAAMPDVGITPVIVMTQQLRACNRLVAKGLAVAVGKGGRQFQRTPRGSVVAGRGKSEAT